MPGEDDVGVRVKESPGQHLVPVGGGSIPMMFFATGGAMDLFGTVIAGALKGQEIMAVKNGEMFQGIGTLQIGKDSLESLAEESGRVD